MDEICEDCGDTVAYWMVSCRCGKFAGYPNFRAAVAEREDLTRRFDEAREDCRARGLDDLLVNLTELANIAQPVIAMPFAVCDDILRPAKYRNYDQRLESNERNPAEATNHGDRAMVGARLFPAYHEHIHYAALSPDGRGLLNYGPVAVRWRVTSHYLGRRATLLEENSFDFYDRHSLGARGASIPSGYRATWEDRGLLVVAKLASRLTPAIGRGVLTDIFLRSGSARGEDEFVEIAIYANEGLDTRDVDLVTLLRRATTPDELHRSELIREVCVSRDVSLVG